MNLAELKALGLTAWIEGDQLALKGPDSLLTDPALIGKISASKPIIIQEIQALSVNLVNLVNVKTEPEGRRKKNILLGDFTPGFNSLMDQPTHDRLHLSGFWGAEVTTTFQQLESRCMAFGWAQEDAEEIAELCLVATMDKLGMVSCIQCAQYCGRFTKCRAQITPEPRQLRRCSHYKAEQLVGHAIESDDP